LEPRLGGLWAGLLRSCEVRWQTDVVDVEMILEHLRDMLESGDRVRRDQNLAGYLGGAESVYEHYRWTEQRLCELVVEEYGEVDAAEAEALYRPLFEGLRARFGIVTLPVFTLNYDVAVESATGRLGVRLIDGTRHAHGRSGWSPAEFHSYAPRDGYAVVLFKLHGSTTWAWDSDGSLVLLPFRTGRDPGALRHAVLYPYLEQKDLEREPFKTGYAYLKACLQRAKWLVIIGTSLRDEHLVRALQAALAANSGLAVALLDLSLDGSGLRKILGTSPWRITGIQGGFSAETAAKLSGQMASEPRKRRAKASGRRRPTSPAAVSP